MGTRFASALILAAQAVAAPHVPSVEIEARALKPGEFVAMTVESPRPPRVRAFGHDVPAYAVGDGRWRALFGIDLDARPGTYPVTIEAGAERLSHDLVVLPKTFRTRRLTVDPDFVTPPPSALERIDRDNQLLHKTWDSSAPERLWSAPFRAPVREPANSAFGTRSVFNGKPRNAHGGADFASPAGTEIHAPNAGRVRIARDLYYSGNTVVIDHGLGLFSMLAHLSAFDVHEGDRVEAGQLVGRVGATGRVTGPHLHWALRAANARVDPLSMLAILGKS